MVVEEQLVSDSNVRDEYIDDDTPLVNFQASTHTLRMLTSSRPTHTWRGYVDSSQHIDDKQSCT